jgi:hypothetical protein
MEYRVTRPEVYGPGTPGYTDVTARQGHYISANTSQEAADGIRSRLEVCESMDVQSWETGVEGFGTLVLHETNDGEKHRRFRYPTP